MTRYSTTYLCGCRITGSTPPPADCPKHGQEPVSFSIGTWPGPDPTK